MIPGYTVTQDEKKIVLTGPDQEIVLPRPIITDPFGNGESTESNWTPAKEEQYFNFVKYARPIELTIKNTDSLKAACAQAGYTPEDGSVVMWLINHLFAE